MFYRLYCTQNHRFMHTGYNDTSLEELTHNYIVYMSLDDISDEELKWWRSRTVEEILENIRSNEFIIEQSTTPFPDLP